MNVCTFIGRIGRDAVTRYTQAGKPVTGWSLAVDTGWGDNKTTLWLDCNLWGDRGDKLAQYITKGAQLGVTGELGTREHDGKTYITLNVRDVTLVGGKPEGQRQQKPQRQEEPAGGGFEDDSLDGIPF